jgi:hypothetical protein
MASLKTQPVLADSGSQEVATLVLSYNHLLDTLGTLITGLKTAADVSAIQTLATAAETSMVASAYKIQLEPRIPASRKFAAK